MDNKFIFLIFLNLQIYFSIRIEFLKDNSSHVVYDTNKIYMNEFFNYTNDKNDICDCSHKNIYYESHEENMTSFRINLQNSIYKNEEEILDNVNNFENSKKYEKIEKINIFSEKQFISSNFTLKNDNEQNYTLDVYHSCQNFDKDYWGLILIEITTYNLTDNNTNLIKFNFIKFCRSPQYAGSVLTVVLLFLFSTLIIFISTRSKISVELTEEKQDGEIKSYHGLLLTITGSVVLLLIFYFIKYINIIFTIIVSLQCSLAFYLTVKTFYEDLQLPQKFTKLNKKIIFMKIEIYSFIILWITIIIITSYLLTRHWILNNLLGFCLVYTILSLFHIKSFKICAILLICAFMYDVFWVYFSPYFFKKNVMLMAATNLNLPIKLEIPILFQSHPLKSCMFLGLGDLVLPGFVVKFGRRFDFLKNTNIYYYSALALYLTALCLSGLVIIIFNYPQPVLFYMCPVLLIGMNYIACRRKETDIWHSELLEENLPQNIIKQFYDLEKVDTESSTSSNSSEEDEK